MWGSPGRTVPLQVTPPCVLQGHSRGGVGLDLELSLLNIQRTEALHLLRWGSSEKLLLNPSYPSICPVFLTSVSSDSEGSLDAWGC